MIIADWLMITAVFLGPIFAVQLTRYLDNKKEVQERKLQVFKSLMATRSYSTSWEHVSALNRIDLEFEHEKNNKAVIDAWKAYLDLLNNKDMDISQWNVKRIDLFVELLHQMAHILKYDFDKTHIKNSSYSPIAHGDIEDEQKKIRTGLIEVLDGKKAIPISVPEPSGIPKT